MNDTTLCCPSEQGTPFEEQEFETTISELLEICANFSYGILSAQRNRFNLNSLQDFKSLFARVESGVIDPVQVVQQLLQRNRTLQRENALVNERRENKLASVITYERLDRFNIRGVFEDSVDTDFLVWYDGDSDNQMADLLLTLLKEQSANFGQHSFIYQRKDEPVCRYSRSWNGDSGQFGEWLVESVGSVSTLQDLERLLGRSKLTSFLNWAGIDVEARIDSESGSEKASPTLVDLISQQSMGYTIRRVIGPIEGWDGSYGFFSGLANQERDSEAKCHMDTVAFLEEIAKERYISTTEFEAIADRLEAKRKRLSRGVRRRIARKFPLFSES